MYKVKIYKAARQDLREIVEYLNTLSPDVAIRYYDRILARLGTLAEMPERTPLAKDTGLRLGGYRMLIVNHYVVYYVVKGDTVQIRRILYGRRQVDGKW